MSLRHIWGTRRWLMIGATCLPSRMRCAAVMYGRRSAHFLDQRTDSGSVAHEKMRTQTDADYIPLISFTISLFLITVKRHYKLRLNWILSYITGNVSLLVIILSVNEYRVLGASPMNCIALYFRWRHLRTWTLCRSTIAYWRGSLIRIRGLKRTENLKIRTSPLRR